MRRRALWCAVVGMAGLQFAAAAPITGTFSMTGTITVTPTTISWFSDQSPFLSNMFTLSAGTGSFASENGQNGIMNLNIATSPVGVPISPPQTFITFDVMPGLPTLQLTFIQPGTSNASQCTATPAVNQTCTPPNPGGSPFTFTNDSSSTSDAKFVFNGVTSDGLSDWTIVFTSQFTEPFQQVLAAFAPGGSGSVTNTYSAAEVTVVAAVPEPGTMILIGVGLICLGLVRRAKRA